ncbi:hypothetical protein CBR_g36271 [Chara braunii]|uniref:Uncharacterized protein n=1 Tax=Chara braunii TaxID=69332 RepID=A0A388LKJ0_CHABU|nr:hypothetical protein CBR_g36271 [Chara braunii]|eukprot:GBG82742.1 hypothetical protein CBR_g36271 [Chara braunii]
MGMRNRGEAPKGDRDRGAGRVLMSGGTGSRRGKLRIDQGLGGELTDDDRDLGEARGLAQKATIRIRSEGRLDVDESGSGGNRGGTQRRRSGSGGRRGGPNMDQSGSGGNSEASIGIGGVGGGGLEGDQDQAAEGRRGAGGAIEIGGRAMIIREESRGTEGREKVEGKEMESGCGRRRRAGGRRRC